MAYWNKLINIKTHIISTMLSQNIYLNYIHSTRTRKQEKRLRELAAQADEDRKSQERMQDMIDKLQQKIKTYKTQVESAVSVF